MCARGDGERSSARVEARVEECAGRFRSSFFSFRWLPLCFCLWYGERWCFMRPGDFAYSLACTVDTCTRNELVLWKDLEQCLHLTRLNLRGDAVEVGLHLTYLRCCLRPPLVNRPPQCWHTALRGLLRGAISKTKESRLPPSRRGIEAASARSTTTARGNRAHQEKG